MSNASSSISALLINCKNLKSLKQIHTQIICKHLEQNHAIISRLLTLCNKLSSPNYAVSVFNRVLKPNLCLYNCIFKLHSDYEFSVAKTLSLFNFMQKEGIFSPDGYTLTSLVKSCANEFDLINGSSLHCLIIHYGLGFDVYVQTSLLDFYGKCRKIDFARKVFDEMKETKNVVSWTTMLYSYLNVGDLCGAKKTFYEMQKRNLVTWNVMIDGYVKAGDMIGARSLFDEMHEKDSISYTLMINGYAKVGDMASARYFFDKGINFRDVFAWSALLSGYEQNGMHSEALKIFLEMRENKIKPDDHIMVGFISACAQMGSLSLAKWVDSYIANSKIDANKTIILSSLIDMHAKCGNMGRASALFESMGKRDLHSYCSMMQGYSLHGVGLKSIELFSRMIREGIVPDNVAFTVVLNACSLCGLVEEGKQYFELMRSKYQIEPTLDHYSCIVDLYGRAGRLKEAYEVIETMPMEPHAGVLGAMLGACRLHCDTELGEIVAKRLFKIEPNNPGNYVLLSNIHAAANNWKKVAELRTAMSERGLRKIPGFTWI